MSSDTARLGPDLYELARFLPAFEEPGTAFGHWTEPIPQEGGAYSAGYVTLSDVGEGFIRAAYRGNWVLSGFDWASWASTVEANAFQLEPRSVSRASPDQLAKLLTVFIRQDRFSEGALLAAFESGYLIAIVRRANELLQLK